MCDCMLCRVAVFACVRDLLCLAVLTRACVRVDVVPLLVLAVFLYAPVCLYVFVLVNFFCLRMC